MVWLTELVSILNIKRIGNGMMDNLHNVLDHLAQSNMDS